MLLVFISSAAPFGGAHCNRIHAFMTRRALSQLLKGKSAARMSEGTVEEYFITDLLSNAAVLFWIQSPITNV
jgi:hypothetical protein